MNHYTRPEGATAIRSARLDRAGALAAIAGMFRAKNFAVARDAIEAALRESPNDAMLLRRLAWACNHLGDADAADEALTRLACEADTVALCPVPTGVPNYDHDAVSASELAELVLLARDETTEALNPTTADSASDDGLRGAEPAASTGQTEADADLAVDGDDSFDPSTDDSIAPLLDDSAIDMLAEAFGETIVSGPPIEIFDETSAELDALEADEVQEAREANTLAGAAKVTRKTRARQAAGILLGRFGYTDSRAIDSVAEILFHFGWNSCCRALADQLNRGATATDLEIAHRVRLSWAGTPHLNASAAYSNERWHAPVTPFPSWTLAVSLAQSFDGIPSTAEIDALIEREFDRYSASRSLQRDFGSFANYIGDCRLDDSGRYLPPAMHTDFDGDWSGSDADAADRWEAYVPMPRVGEFGFVAAIADRLALSENVFRDLHVQR